MLYTVLADMTVLVHALFVLFVVFGGLAVFRWRRLVWVHLPAAIWGGVIELSGWVCPLTYLENYFRRLGGESGYRGTFIERYLEPVLYPLGLTQHTQIILGLLAILFNLLIYLQLWRRNKNRLP
jgi:hypothetical protein